MPRRRARSRAPDRPGRNALVDADKQAEATAPLPKVLELRTEPAQAAEARPGGDYRQRIEVGVGECLGEEGSCRVLVSKRLAEEPCRGHRVYLYRAVPRGQDRWRRAEGRDR